MVAFCRTPEGGICIYALAALAAAVAAYFLLFTQFAPYDDEGTSLITLKAFLSGDTLYRDIYTPFGPFYYEFFGGLFSLSGQSVTTDASRTLVLAIWVGSSLLIGLAVQRLTARLGLGVAAMLLAFAVVFILSQEPMHAQVLAVGLLATFTLTATVVEGRWLSWAGAACGALVAALVLTKVNLGIYAFAAVCFAAVLAVGPLQRRRWIFWPVLIAFFALPFLATDRDLNGELVRHFAILDLLAAIAIAVAAWSLRAPADRDAERPTVRWLVAAAAGFGLAFGGALAVIALLGSSPADVYDGMIVQALRIRDVNPTLIASAAAAIDWGIAAIAAAGLVCWLRARGEGGLLPPLWSGLARGAAGLAIWFTISQGAPVSLGPGPGNPLALAMVLAWVAVIPPAGREETAQKRFLRVLLPALGVAEALQVYPVAGSQVRIAAVTFVAVGGLCLADSLALLREWSASRGRLALRRFGAIVTVAIAALGAKFAVDGVVLPGITKAILYGEQRPLPFPGAGSLRLPPAEAEAYEGIVDLLRRYRCTDFIGFANVDSLYLWSGIDAPRPAPPSAWMLALDEPSQLRVLRQIRAARRPCVVRNEYVASIWLADRPRPETPLVRYLFSEFEPVAKSGDFELLLPKRPAAGS